MSWIVDIWFHFYLRWAVEVWSFGGNTETFGQNFGVCREVMVLSIRSTSWIITIPLLGVFVGRKVIPELPHTLTLIVLAWVTDRTNGYTPSCILRLVSLGTYNLCRWHHQHPFDSLSRVQHVPLGKRMLEWLPSNLHPSSWLLIRLAKSNECERLCYGWWPVMLTFEVEPGINMCCLMRTTWLDFMHWSTTPLP